jgi:Mg-chelatase subunit ChlD
MLDYLESLDTDEHVSLSTYDSLARIERNLSTDLAAINSRMREMQAGHYDRETNIGDGIKRGRESLTGSFARLGAKKVLIVLTDGLANEPGTEAYARQYALDQAKLAADQEITIHSISFTSRADQSLMAEIAKIGKGVHFHVNSYDVTQYSRDLERVLLTISSIRPLVLSK